MSTLPNLPSPARRGLGTPGLRSSGRRSERIKLPIFRGKAMSNELSTEEIWFNPRIPQNIWSKIRRVGEPDCCWVWLGSLSGSSRLGGYPEGWITGRGKVRVHRFIYEEFFGRIQVGLDLDHLCRNRKCCNPFHCEPVTRSENNLRGLVGQNRVIECALALTCDRGHPWTPENTLYGKEQRMCKVCRNARQRFYRSGKVGSLEDYM